MKKPITISNTKINSSNSSGIIIFYDDRTGGSAGELVTQNLIDINNNTIDLPNSNYIITGLTSSTINNINIRFINNIITPDSVILCNTSAYENPNISIEK